MSTRRTRTKTPFMVSVVRPDGTLKVIKGGFTGYKDAENWCKRSDGANADYDFSDAVKFFIFHAKKTITVVFEETAKNSNDDFNNLITEPTEDDIQASDADSDDDNDGVIIGSPLPIEEEAVNKPPEATIEAPEVPTEWAEEPVDSIPGSDIL